MKFKVTGRTKTHSSFDGSFITTEISAVCETNGTMEDLKSPKGSDKLHLEFFIRANDLCNEEAVCYDVEILSVEEVTDEAKASTPPPTKKAIGYVVKQSHPGSNLKPGDFIASVEGKTDDLPDYPHLFQPVYTSDERGFLQNFYKIKN